MPDEFEPMRAALAIEGDLRSQGRSEEEIDSFMFGLRTLDFDTQTQAMREAGVPEMTIEVFWQELGTFGDADPLDTVDAGD